MSMTKLRTALEDLDKALFGLEDEIYGDTEARREMVRKHAETLKQARAREAEVLSIAQKVAARLDRSIDQVETMLRVE